MSETDATSPHQTGDREPSTLDVRGLQCPLPVLKARKALKALENGDVLKLVSTDPMASLDVPHFCLEAGHTLLSETRDGDDFVFEIMKGG